MEQSLALLLNHITQISPLTSGVVVFLAQYFPYLVVLGFVYFAVEQWKHPLSISPSKEVERLKLLVKGIGAGVVARIFVEVIRVFVERSRPFVDNPAIVALFHETNYSFPSGHAAFFFALSTVVFLYNKRWGVWFYIASAIIGLARIAAGVHYPTDILGGAVLGVVIGWIVHALPSRLFSR